MFDSWDWEDTVSTAVLAGVVCIVALVGKVLIAEHKVDGYYLSGSGGTAPLVCVYSHWTWHTDEKVFCTVDSGKALEFAKQANALLK